MSESGVAYSETAKPTYKWLPAQMSNPQPYSMGPLLRWDPHFMRLFPESPSSRRMDFPLAAIQTCLVAPSSVQREAQARGEQGIMMIRVPGLLRCLGREDSSLELLPGEGVRHEQ